MAPSKKGELGIDLEYGNGRKREKKTSVMQEKVSLRDPAVF